MTSRLWLICLLVGCDKDTAVDPTVDAAPPIPDSFVPKPCKTFGPLTKHGPVRGPGGAPLIATGIASDPHVIRDGETLKMWFTTASTTPPHELRTAYAESMDGRNWTNVRDGVIRPTPNTFDGQGIETVSVLREPSGFVAYYTGDHQPEDSNRYSIGRATSPDGLTWTKHSGAVLTPTLPWERPFCIDDACTQRIGGVLEPSVLVEGGMYRMWYAGLGAVDGVPSYRIGTRWSTNGIDWSPWPSPVFTAGSPGAWDEALVSHPHVIADPGGGYHLFYFGASLADHDRCDMAGGCLFVPGAIGHAFSQDGKAWTRDPSPVLRSESGFDAWSLGGPSVLIENGTVHAWYMGTPVAQTLDIQIGYATAPCL